MKKADTKAFLRSKADGIKKKNDDGTKQGSVAQAAAEPADNVKEKKEKVLAAARKKMGMSEEQRQDFKERAKKSKEKKQAASSTNSSPPGGAATAPGQPQLGAPGRVRRSELDPNKSVFSQRVTRTMEQQGLTREAARQVVTDRRVARKEQMADVQQQFNVGEGRSRNIVRYAKNNPVTPADGTAASPDYGFAKRVVMMARNKGLTKKEAGTVIAGRRQARQDAASGTQPQA